MRSLVIFAQVVISLLSLSHHLSVLGEREGESTLTLKFALRFIASSQRTKCLFSF